MTKTIVALLHAGFWLCYLLLIIVILGVLYGDSPQVEPAQIKTSLLTILFFAFIPSALTFYGFYFIVFPRYLKQKKFAASVVYGLLISYLSAIVGYAFLAVAVFEKNCPPKESGYYFLPITLFMSFIALICGIIALVMQGFITWFGEIKLKELLAQKNHEMELALVKSQLDPHFLFNTINNIDVLILKNATEASEYLNKLSHIMRFMLYETKSDSIPLAKEMEYIQKYVELQKIRTANSTYVHFEITGEPRNKNIAPMVFIPFIENAFKHTTNKKTENAIHIRINIDELVTRFECRNRFNPETKTHQEHAGLGNGLIKKRLDLIYPEKHSLETTIIDEVYQVTLTINHE